MNLQEIQDNLQIQNTCQDTQSTCQNNTFNELRPTCSIMKQPECDVTKNCYWTGTACTAMSPQYCQTEQASTNISACRKGGNDFCYWQNNTCKTCNDHEYSENNKFKKLISMEGTSCIPEDIGCAPYYRQKEHAACRKYCEIYQQANNSTYVCDRCEAGSLFGKCFANKTGDKCTNLQQISLNLANYFNEATTSNQTFVCISNANVNGQSSKTVLSGITVYPNKTFATPGSYKIQTLPNGSQYIAYECEQPWVLRPYQPLSDGETGATYTANMEQENITKRAPSFVCSCPPGYFLNSNKSTCSKCTDGNTTYDYDQTTCVTLCKSDQVWSQGQCKSQCAINEIAKDMEGIGIKVCQQCPNGFVNIDEECVAVPKSYFVNIIDSNPTTFNLDDGSIIKRCKNNMTTQDINSFRESQCNVATSQGMKIKADGEIASSCEPGTYLMNSVYCTPCEAGKQIPLNISPDAANQNMCEPCPKGTYKNIFDASCVECEGPYTTTIEGATSKKNNCTSCLPGIVLEDLTCSTEKKCLNEFSGISNGRCIKNCPPGKGFLSDNSRICEQCPSGQANPDNNMCINTSVNKTNNTVIIAVPIVVILLIIAIVLGVVFGLKARKAKKNNLVETKDKKIAKKDKQYTSQSII